MNGIGRASRFCFEPGDRKMLDCWRCSGPLQKRKVGQTIVFRRLPFSRLPLRGPIRFGLIGDSGLSSGEPRDRDPVW